MQPFLEAYLEIENTPRNHRTRSHLLAQLLARFPNMGQIAFEDLLLLLERLEQSQVKIRMPLFAQVIYPVLQREIKSGNLQAVSVLLQYTVCLYNYNRMHHLQDGYSEGALIKRYLQRDPENHDILLRKEAFLAKMVHYALHELPQGVLYGINGATAEQCGELLNLLEDYTRTCQTLQLDRSATIRYAAMHFQGYQDYLLHRQLYKNYLDYIHQHHLELPKGQPS